MYLNELTNNKSTEYSLWGATQGLKRPIIQNPPVRNMDGSWARNNAQKTKRFAEYLEHTFEVNEGKSN